MLSISWFLFRHQKLIFRTFSFQSLFVFPRFPSRFGFLGPGFQPRISYSLTALYLANWLLKTLFLIPKAFSSLLKTLLFLRIFVLAKYANFPIVSIPWHLVSGNWHESSQSSGAAQHNLFISINIGDSDVNMMLQLWVIILFLPSKKYRFDDK